MRIANKICLFLLIITFLSSSCVENDDEHGGQKEKEAKISQIDDFPGGNREFVTAFMYNNVAYIGLGSEEGDHTDNLYSFWKYDLDGGKWSQLKDYPINEDVSYEAIYNGLGVSIAGFVYVIGETCDNRTAGCSGLYRYDPANDTWERHVTIPSNVRQKGRFVVSAMNIYDKMYFLYSSGEFIEYNPSINEFAFKREFPETVSANHVFYFSINNIGYIGLTGLSNYGPILYAYDVSSDSWSARIPLDRESYRPYSFTLNGKGYLGGGEGGSEKDNDYFWIYDPAQDQWSKGPNAYGISSLMGGISISSGQSALYGLGTWPVVNLRAYIVK